MSKQRLGTGLGSGNGPVIRRSAYVGGGFARSGVMLGSGHRLAGGNLRRRRLSDSQSNGEVVEMGGHTFGSGHGLAWRGGMIGSGHGPALRNGYTFGSGNGPTLGSGFTMGSGNGPASNGGWGGSGSGPVRRGVTFGSGS
jgi:hypothetical protein